MSNDKNGYDLFEMLSEYDGKGYIPFHMPGHKRNIKYADFLGALNIDITEIEGFDNLHAAQGVLKEERRRAARLFGSEHARYSVGGSTACIYAAMRTLAARGDRIIIARNCHRSVYGAAELIGLRAEYILPQFDEEHGFYLHISPSQLEKTFERYPDAKAFVCTSPTYEGIVSDIAQIAEICHDHGAALIVDEAHGAHLGFDGFLPSARMQGADIVVNSLHKTLPCLTQTALLHCASTVDLARLDESLALFQTSSPSYVLMGAISGVVGYLEKNGESEAHKWRARLDRFYNRLSSLKRLKLYRGEGAYAFDLSKLVIMTDRSDITGTSLAARLRDDYKIELEMASSRYAIAMSGMGDDQYFYDALESALFEIDSSLDEYGKDMEKFLPQLPQQVVYPYQVDALTTEYVDFKDAHDRVAAENIFAYPPGSPLIVKGETLSAEICEQLLDMTGQGININSSLGSFPKKLLVVSRLALDKY